MDRSLDEIIAEDTHKTNRPSGGRRGQGRRRGDRDGVRKPYTQDRVDLNVDWVHDKFNDDDRDSRPRGPRRRHSPDRSSALTKVRVDNLHYDITESDLEDLFTQIGPVSALNLSYDRAGRSEGVAYITYTHLRDAHTSVREFDGANAKGQPIRLSLVPGRRPERGDRGGGGSSLFDRVERPGRDARSLSPTSDKEGDSRRRRGGGRVRRSDVSRPAPEHIDRYVPGQRSQGQNQRSGGRRGGRDNRNRNDEQGGRRAANGRPRKTQEELDQEMEDYWGGNGNDASADTAAAQPEPAVTQSAPAEAAAAPAAAATTAPATADDDIDMIE